MVGNVQAARGMLHDAEVEEELPGQLLLQRQIEEGERRVMRTV